MFVDYYAILNVHYLANSESIKSAYKRQAIQWHPDNNVRVDTTKRMQLINEAYLILKDTDARKLYNQEYLRYKSKTNNTENPLKPKVKDEHLIESIHLESVLEPEEFEVENEVLLKWMRNARQQSIELAKQSLKDLQGMSKESGSAMANAAFQGIFKYLVFGIIFTIIIRACKS